MDATLGAAPLVGHCWRMSREARRRTPDGRRDVRTVRARMVAAHPCRRAAGAAQISCCFCLLCSAHGAAASKSKAGSNGVHLQQQRQQRDTHRLDHGRHMRRSHPVGGGVSPPRRKDTDHPQRRHERRQRRQRCRRPGSAVDHHLCPAWRIERVFVVIVIIVIKSDSSGSSRASCPTGRCTEIRDLAESTTNTERFRCPDDPSNLMTTAKMLTHQDESARR